MIRPGVGDIEGRTELCEAPKVDVEVSKQDRYSRLRRLSFFAKGY